MNLDIQYYTKHVYGMERKYPASPDAHVICKLMHMNTLNEHFFNVCGEMEGVTITQVLPPVNQ